MGKNDDQVCVLGVYFPCDTNARAADIKDKIEALLADIPEAKVELTLRSGGGNALHTPRVSQPLR